MSTLPMTSTSGPTTVTRSGPRRTRRTRRRAVALVVLSSLALGAGACGNAEPTTADRPASDGSGTPGPGAEADGATAGVDPGANDPATAAPVATTTIDPGTLPQTEDQPASNSPAFDRRVQALWDGIVNDDPQAAMPFFFPLTAYRQVKPIQDPDGDWNNRLVRTYEREIHALHDQLGSNPAAATFEGIEVPTQNAQWMKPGTEYNKLPYWRVLNSKVRYRVNGQTKSFVVSSMISWRGEWYVVHLTAPPR